MTHKNLKNQPTAFVVFGATGDLTQNKLYPSLYELAKRQMLPKHFILYGIAREKMSASAFKNDIERDLKRHYGKSIDKAAIKLLLNKVRYMPADLNKPGVYHDLEKMIQADEQKKKKPILRIFYLALPPFLFEKVIKHVNTCKAGSEICSLKHVYSRVIIEKPFGYDYISAAQLDKQVKKAFGEKQIYRIDHYLGKDAFQSVFAFRFANSYFENAWSNKYIDSIEINALEEIGTEGRYSYYDGADAVSDRGLFMVK